ncbi:hypothetical protein [Bradyrhizobium sp. dw_411]|nr:hypothetical protein [Bradyrhizobium sp. dw_411]
MPAERKSPACEDTARRNRRPTGAVSGKGGRRDQKLQKNKAASAV